jgi:hypothetical protein
MPWIGQTRSVNCFTILDFNKTSRNKVIPKYACVRIYVLNFNWNHIDLNNKLFWLLNFNWNHIGLNNKLFQMKSLLRLYSSVTQYKNLCESSCMLDGRLFVAKMYHVICMKS